MTTFLENWTFNNRYFSNRYFLALKYGIYFRILIHSIHRIYLLFTYLGQNCYLFLRTLVADRVAA